MPSTALSASELRDRLERAKATVRNLKEHSEAAIEKAIDGAAVLAGGATSGMVRGLWGDPKKAYDAHIPGTEIDVDLALGTAASVAALFGVGGKYAGTLGLYGYGLLACVTGRETFRAVLKMQEAAPKK